jgi:perosamine synthetase
VDWFVYVVRLDPTIDRSAVIAALDARGVPSRPYFSPLHLQPAYRDVLGHRPGDFPVTERVAASTLALPFSAVLTDDDARYVADALIEVVEGAPEA